MHSKDCTVVKQHNSCLADENLKKKIVDKNCVTL